jgi:hypothetical protein
MGTTLMAGVAAVDEDNAEGRLSLLFIQLTWPSVIVRERASVAIADLLLNPECSERTREYLLHWISLQRLESIAALGLLTLLRARLQNSEFTIPSIEILSRAFARPSVFSWLLLTELSPDSDLSLVDSLNHSGTYPADFVLTSVFDDYVEGYLPPIFNHWGDLIEERFGIPFRQQWAYEWQQLLNETGRTPSSSELRFWFGFREEQEGYFSADTQVSEVYRSAFLRALAWAVQSAGMDSDEALLLAGMMSPVDLELWRLSPIKRPEWWPRADEPEGKIDTIPAQVWRQVEDLWEYQREREDGWILTEANGLVHKGNTVYDLEIYGVFQKFIDDKNPDLEEITDWYQEEEKFKLRYFSRLHFRGRMNTLQQPEKLARTSGGWTLIPAAGPTLPLTSLRWQFWRITRRIWLPTPFLGETPLTFDVSDNSVNVRDGSGEVIGKWNDWTDGLSEKMVDGLPLSTGQFLLQNRQRILDFAEINNAAFCWVCRLNVYQHTNRWDRITNYREFGSTRIFRG